ncbi:hypothetical protein CBOM_07038 [Ceraceosorus bombacis]|uniref:Uncharacterized protein n=1 Tax=Ceraceosorus bombacis TaxID=401625 RepID=A0A0P1BL15_9BASI|nr:hypothetical protein CBOM_07038 [Ceraceosorus bombacis]
MAKSVLPLAHLCVIFLFMQSSAVRGLDKTWKPHALKGDPVAALTVSYTRPPEKCAGYFWPAATYNDACDIWKQICLSFDAKAVPFIREDTEAEVAKNDRAYAKVDCYLPKADISYVKQARELICWAEYSTLKDW